MMLRTTDPGNDMAALCCSFYHTCRNLVLHIHCNRERQNSCKNKKNRGGCQDPGSALSGRAPPTLTVNLCPRLPLFDSIIAYFCSVVKGYFLSIANSAALTWPAV
jgi:hypothetical protein